MTEYENNYQKFTKFRDEYKTFYFESFKANLSDFYIELELDYSFDKKIDFRHILRIKKNSTLKNIIDINDLNKYKKEIIGIGIAEGISYYKLIGCENFEVECDQLSDEEKIWWRKLYYKGLGEYRYLNNIKISENEFVNFKSSGNIVDKVDNVSCETLKGNLILVGGGKDSNTSLELLSKDKEDNLILILNPRSASYDSSKVAGYNDDQIIVVERIIDKKLIEMNKEGYLNGHVPFSAILSFIATFIATLTNKKYVVASNESSANEDTVEGANHQYSKTFEYENDFREYAKKSLFNGEAVSYYSILRPIYEIQIVKMFIKYKKYLNVFKSCNIGSRIVNSKEIWCGECPKCLFVYILLLSQLSEKEVIDIIGNNMLDNIKMKEDFDKLIGILPEKPFECIGTKEEVNAALSIIINKNEYKNNENIPYLLKYYKEECKKLHKTNEEIDKLLHFWNNNNNVSCETEQIMKQILDIK